MIKCEQVKNYSCDNCNREINFILKYTFTHKGEKYNEFALCEDCSNGLSDLHYKVMEKGRKYNYNGCEMSER